MKNCWEFKNCGREVGGANTAEMGVCPAASDKSSNGVNNGKNGGRICWAVSGTFCGGTVQGSYAQKMNSCLACEVYKTIKQEEASNFELMTAATSK